MMAYLVGPGMVCGALVSWVTGPKGALSLLARWLPRAALVLFAALALSIFLASEVLAIFAGHALYATLGFFAGGLTQAAGMAFARSGFGAAGNWGAVLLTICLWAALFVAVGMRLRGA